MMLWPSGRDRLEAICTKLALLVSQHRLPVDRSVSGVEMQCQAARTLGNGRFSSLSRMPGTGCGNS